MGVLSNTVSISRYKIMGKIEEPINETIYEGLKKNAFTEIEDDSSEKISGWTSFDNPFSPNFEGASYMFGHLIVCSLRIDKKSVPPKIIKKYCATEYAKRLAESGREFLSKAEKSEIMENVEKSLLKRIPATPNMYDLIWNYEQGMVWFFSTLKAANEELEDMFSKSFNLRLIRLFPYTSAELLVSLSNDQKDALNKLKPIKFTE